MLELATVRLLLSPSTEVTVPSEGCSIMLTPNTVMDMEEVCIPAFGVPSPPRWSDWGAQRRGCRNMDLRDGSSCSCWGVLAGGRSGAGTEILDEKGDKEGTANDKEVTMKEITRAGAP